MPQNGFKINGIKLAGNQHNVVFLHSFFLLKNMFCIFGSDQCYIFQGG